jgi:hypothetical protein
MADKALEEAWNAVHDATPANWSVGRPSYIERYDRFEQFAFDTTDRGRPGKPHTREWTAVGQTDVECLEAIVRCLREISEGRWPRRYSYSPGENSRW